MENPSCMPPRLPPENHGPDAPAISAQLARGQRATQGGPAFQASLRRGGIVRYEFPFSEEIP